MVAGVVTGTKQHDAALAYAKFLVLLRGRPRDRGEGHGALRQAAVAGRSAALLAPLAVRAFTPVFDGLWRGRHGKMQNRNSAR